MSSGRKFLFTFSFLVVDVLLIGFIFLMRDVTFKNVLKKEVAALVQLDFTKDSYNTETKITGEYANIEIAIKEYLNDYSTDVQTIFKVDDDKKINNMLSITNYKEDGPLFVESLNYLETIRNDLNNNTDLLMERVSEKEINEYIYNYSSNDKSVELYNNLLLESNLTDKVIKNQEMVENKRIEINSYIDSIYNVLVFLRDNSDAYTIVSDDISFNDRLVEKQYYDLVNKTKRIYE